jgi:hypothetical protein
MKTPEMINVALTYAVVVAMANLVLKVLHYDKPGVALIAAAVAATEVAAWSYQRRARTPAPFSVKLSVGLLIAAVCVIQSITFQAVWHWMSYPTAAIIVGTIGTFAVPLIIFGRLQKRIVKSRNDRRPPAA